MTWRERFEEARDMDVNRSIYRDRPSAGHWNVLCRCGHGRWRHEENGKEMCVHYACMCSGFQEPGRLAWTLEWAAREVPWIIGWIAIGFFAGCAFWHFTGPS